MKKPLFHVKLAMTCLFFASISSCKKSQIPDSVPVKGRSQMTINTNTGQNSCFDWETSPYVTLTNGQTRTLPWYNGATTQIPDFVLEDYKKEDGWVLLYNMLNGTENGQNYLMYYNKFTGIMRNFYFLADNVNEGTNGMWGLSFSNTNSLLNNTTYFASPIDSPSSNPLATTTNISMDGTTKAISRGWNAFDTEITYDPASVAKDIKMRLLSYNNNIQNVSLTGDIALSSSGTIVSIGSKNGAQDLANGAAKLAGKAAGNWIKDKVQPGNGASSVIKLISSGIPAVVSGGVTEIVKAGINLLFGSFIGKQKQETTTNQKIEFKTNGTVNLSGNISFTSANNVSPVANLYTPGTQMNPSNFLLPCYNKKLGVWNLESAPVVRTDLKVPFSHISSDGSYGIYLRSYFVVKSSIKVVMNPDVLTEIDSYDVKTDLIYYDKFKGSTTWNTAPIGSMTNGILAYDDNENKFYSGVPQELFPGPVAVIDGNTNPRDFPSVEIEEFNKKFVVKVTVTLKPKAGYDQSPIVITRSYLPNYIHYIR